MTTSQEQFLPSPPSPSPTIIHHPLPTLHPISPPQIVHPAVGGAHYSGTHSWLRSHRRTSSDGQPSRATQSPEDELTSRQRIMNDLMELYCCRPSLEIFERIWRHDSIFEDPWVRCEGYDQYAPQWFVMPKLFSQSRTLSSRLMLSTPSPNRFIYSQSQEYTIRFIGKKKQVDSIIVVDLDENDRIIRLEDKWGGEDLPMHYGALLLRRVNARIASWLIKVPRWQS
ncbi:hypothetical protein J3A83DRAFT_4096743 [Scleroderma citrinum]